MNSLSVGRWKVEYDPCATASAYAGVPTGAHETCGCLPCRNFAAQRDNVYSPAFVQLLDTLGVNRQREAEIYYCCKADSGLHLYGGWFHFVGTIAEGSDALASCQLALVEFGPGFSLGVSAKCACLPDAFLGRGDLAQLEFLIELPWVLPDPEPS